MAGETPPGVEVRLYRDTDREAVSTINVISDSSKLWAKPARDAQQLLRESPGYLDDRDVDAHILVATLDGQWVGAALFGRESPDTNEFWIWSLGVDAGHQRLGIGTLIKKAVLLECESIHSGAIIKSEVDKYNTPMLGLNDKLGVTRELNGRLYFSFVTVEPIDDEAKEALGSESRNLR